MKLTDFLDDVGRPIAYYPSLRKLTGSTTATILLCQFIYWRGKESDPEGWLYKDSEEIEKETGLSYEEQKSARARLKDRQLIEEYYARLDHQMRFRVNLDMVNELWGKGQNNLPEQADTTFPNKALPLSRTSQRHIPEQGNATFGNECLPCSLNESEITTEITTEIAGTVLEINEQDLKDASHKTNDPESLDSSLPRNENPSGQINPNSGRRTDAIVKGNAFDGMLYFAGAAAARAEELGVTIEMLDRINEFPEDVRDTLRVISQLCVWLPAAIPSVRKKSEHEQWVNELRDVNAQLGGTGEEGLKAAHKIFKDWTVSHPSAIIKAVKSEAGKVAKRQSANKETEFTGIDTPYARMLDNPPVYTPEHEQMLADFRKKLRDRVSSSKNLNH